MMTELSEMEKKLITMRYFQDKTQTEVANACGISQVQVSRMEKKARLQLQQALAE